MSPGQSGFMADTSPRWPYNREQAECAWCQYISCGDEADPNYRRRDTDCGGY